MIINKKIAKLISEIEWILGSQVYNPYVYDSDLDLRGFIYRYPLSFPKSESTFVKIRTKMMNAKVIDKKDFTYQNISAMIYKFGPNEMQIGHGIIKVLDFLEIRYGINFSKLEDDLNEKNKKLSKMKL